MPPCSMVRSRRNLAEAPTYPIVFLIKPHARKPQHILESSTAQAIPDAHRRCPPWLAGLPQPYLDEKKTLIKVISSG
jgi:hypothetical protein